MKSQVFSTAFLVTSLMSPALAETCVPVDPATGNGCIYDFRIVFDGQFKYMYWNNSCLFDVEVDWQADKMTGKVLVGKRNALQPGVGLGECYSYCGAISWSAVCKGIPKNAMSVSREGTSSEAPTVPSPPEARSGGDAGGREQAPIVAAPTAAGPPESGQESDAGGRELDFKPVRSIAAHRGRRFEQALASAPVRVERCSRGLVFWKSKNICIDRTKAVKLGFYHRLRN